MSAVAHMPRKKKTEAPAATGEGEGEGEKKNVKVAPEFHRKLKMIAAATKKDMGDIIEDEMKLFIDREMARIREGQ